MGGSFIEFGQLDTAFKINVLNLFSPSKPHKIMDQSPPVINEMAQRYLMLKDNISRFANVPIVQNGDQHDLLSTQFTAFRDHFQERFDQLGGRVESLTN